MAEQIKWRVHVAGMSLRRQPMDDLAMTTLNIPDMTCGHCKATVETTLSGLDPMADVTVDLPAKTVRLETDADIETVLKALAEKGFPATVAA